jgi:hypothetical protein
MNTSIYNTKMLIVKCYWNIFINAITNIAHHKFLKSNWLELHFFFTLLLLRSELFWTTMSQQIRKHKFHFQNHFGLIEACLFILTLIWLRKQLFISDWLIRIDFYSEMSTIIYFNFFLTKSDHKCSRIIFHVFLVNRCW